MSIKFVHTNIAAKAVKEIEGVGVLTVVYAKDPEGNIVEIQSWK
jgi:catechol-2,3-dioxygenase